MAGQWQGNGDRFLTGYVWVYEVVPSGGRSCVTGVRGGNRDLIGLRGGFAFS